MNRPERRVSFNAGWRFFEGELASPPRRSAAKAGKIGGWTDLAVDELPAAVAAVEQQPFVDPDHPGVDISAAQYARHPRPVTLGPRWRHVTVPHDWRIAHQPSPDHAYPESYTSPMQGFLPVGVGYYRKVFDVQHRDGDRVLLHLEAVMRCSDVWVNGFWFGFHQSGYTPRRIDITAVLRTPDQGGNVVLVRCDTRESEGWWYEGAGLYRDAWLEVRPSTLIEQDDLTATSSLAGEPSAEGGDRARLTLTVPCRNTTSRTQNGEVRIRVLGPDGDLVATADQPVRLDAHRVHTVTQTLTVAAVARWHIGRGNVYRICVTLTTGDDGTDVDTVELTHGFRTIDFDTRGRLLLNGEHVTVRGVNLHADFFGVGTAVPDSLHAYKLALARETGANLVRSAHHMASAALLDLTDRLGIMVVDENRLLSSAPPYRDDLTSLVKTNRHHPSIVFWALENEEADLEGTATGTQILGELAALVHELDPSRPTTVGGVKGHGHAGYYETLDVVGVQYGGLMGHLQQVRDRYPDRPVLATEEGLAPTVRGQYADDEARGYSSAFGSTLGLHAALTAFAEGVSGNVSLTPVPTVWHDMEARDDLVGTILWAGMDYHGEPNPNAWPGTVSSFGVRDLLGLPKDYYWLIRSHWDPAPVVHVFPHWTWTGREGQPVRVGICTNADHVRLELDGEVVFDGDVDTHYVDLDPGITYRPGELLARGYRDGVEVARHRPATAGAAASLRLDTPRTALSTEDGDTLVVRVSVRDADGELCPQAGDSISFDVSGPARIVGVGNGDPSSNESATTPYRRAFRGWAAVLVQTTGEPGTIRVTARADGLGEASLGLTATTAPVEAAVATDESRSR